MTNIVLPPTNYPEILTECECAKRLELTREALSHLRDMGMPFIPLSDGIKPRIRYAWIDVFTWLRSRSRNLAATQSPQRGRPRNIDRAGRGGDGAAR